MYRHSCTRENVLHNTVSNRLTDSMDMSLSKLWGMVKDGEARGAAATGRKGKEWDTTERLNKSVVWAVVSLTSPTAKSRGSFLAG